jgi:hypothetical protein
MEHKNDYTVVAIFPGKVGKKWIYAHKLNEFAKFLDEKHPAWLYMNVYERRTRKYLKRFYKGNLIPPFL